MIKIKIITLGKLKERYLNDAVEEYLKRLSGYAKTEIIELTPVKLSDNPSEQEITKALDTEADLILKKLNGKEYITALCIEGKQMSSEELSAEVSANINGGEGNLVYIIGSSYGLSQKIKNIANKKLSFVLRLRM